MTLDELALEACRAKQRIIELKQTIEDLRRAARDEMGVDARAFNALVAEGLERSRTQK